ncbi:hypothetical protein [Arthrobacter sp.]|uniref:DUF7507 domain-containing protein n=1 Tax=Arthrobacter sp. TaxID=1667 RepID=UPI002810D0D8|nr:hypothetical protein [Arthrobacter sp.]
MLTSPTDLVRVPRAAGFVRTVRSATVRGVSAGVLLAAGFGFVVAPAAHAAPGTPGVPGDPVVLFIEDFENRAPGSNIRLDAYTGTTGQEYSADPYWLSGPACNGMVVDFTTPHNGTDCSAIKPELAADSFQATKDLVNVLGVVGGSETPATNSGVSAYTEGDGPANAVEFQTVTPITFPAATGRFVTFGVDAAALNCREDFVRADAETDPLLAFHLKDSTGEHPVSNEPIDVCADGTPHFIDRPSSNNTARAGSYVADGSVLLTGDSFGIVLRNVLGNWMGNDHAFDNITVLDVTPQLDKSFSPVDVPLNGTSTLTFTVTNTSELGAKNGWSFTDNLPAGLTLASPAAAATTCPGGTVTAVDGGTSVAVAGNLSEGMASCTVTVDATSGTAGVYTNGPGNVTVTGLNPPGNATVTFGGSLALVKSVAEEAITDAGQTLHYSFNVTNTSNVTLAPITITETAFSGTGGSPLVSCPAGAASLAPKAQVTCTAEYTVTLQDFNTGIITNTAVAHGGTTNGHDVVSNPSDAQIKAMPPVTPAEDPGTPGNTPFGEPISPASTPVAEPSTTPSTEPTALAYTGAPQFALPLGLVLLLGGAVFLIVSKRKRLRH